MTKAIVAGHCSAMLDVVHCCICMQLWAQWHLVCCVWASLKSLQTALVQFLSVALCPSSGLCVMFWSVVSFC
jgi:lipid-A-disaccharide synthase-like uncharacterized protein